MKVIKRIALSILVVIVSTVVAIYIKITAIPDMTTPVRVVGGTLMLDGGSRVIEVQDSKGKLIYISIKAISGKSKIHFPLRVYHYPQFLLASYSPALGSDYEKDFIKHLEWWSGESECESFLQAHERIGQKSGLYGCKEIGDLYPIYSILRARN